MSCLDVQNKIGWAFGLGLERIAMVLFSIPDIRLFWSEDPRFLSQFEQGKINAFQAYSKYPSCFKDVSFWTPQNAGFHENDFCDIIRDTAGDLVENVEKVLYFLLFSAYSHCYMCRSTSSSSPKQVGQVCSIA